MVTTKVSISSSNTAKTNSMSQDIQYTPMFCILTIWFLCFPIKGFHSLPYLFMLKSQQCPGYVVMYWHSNDLCKRISLWERTVQPVYSQRIYFQFHFPSIHEWLWFRVFWHKILTQPSHRKSVEITSKKGTSFSGTNEVHYTYWAWS